jgi:hypothetical protein
MPTKIEEFESQLKKIKNGATFVKADFHIHSPDSFDYKYNGSDKYDKLAEAIATANYAYAVVLDHESFPTKETISRISEKTPNTLIIPGAEINVFVDAYNREDRRVESNMYYHCILAVDPKDPSAGEFLLRNAMKDLLYEQNPTYPSGFKSNIIEVSKYFIDGGAMFIPAHLHQKNKAEGSRSIDDIYGDTSFLDFIKRNCFTALEVTDKGTAKFFNGSQKTKSGTEIPYATIVRSTDAHSPNEIAERDRYTWVQVENNTFEELEAALRIPHRCSLEEPSQTEERFVGLHVEGDFIKNEWVHLNPRINCFIGAKGSGKTSFLEAIRFVLGLQSDADKRESIQKHVARILGDSGYVECLIQTKNGKKLISRRADSRHRIRIIDEADNVTEVEAGSQELFNTTVLGWHEIESVADKQDSRINLIDLTGNKERIDHLKTEIKVLLSEAKEVLPMLQLRYKELIKQYNKWNALDTKRKTLKKLEQANLTTLETKYQHYLNIEQSVKSLIKEATSKITNSFIHIKSEVADILKVQEFKDLGLSTSIATLYESLVKVNSNTEEAKSSLSLILTDILTISENFESIFSKEFLEFKQNQYEVETAKLSPEDKNILAQQIAILEETRELPTFKINTEVAQKALTTEAEKVFQIFDKICNKREEILSIREKSVAEINRSISELRLKLNPDKIQLGREQLQQRFSEDVGLVDSFLNRNVSGGGYFKKLKQQFGELASINVFDNNFHDIDYNILTRSAFLEFGDLRDDDDVMIEWKSGRADFRALDSLSAGQRCTAVFPILLRMDNGPLVLDQPEDNLDNRYIADTIVDNFLVSKFSRQYFLTSHNANLVVMTDADLIVHMDSDGTAGSVIKSGFLACSDSAIKDSVLSVLDGGEKALMHRKEKYGL